MDGSSSRNSTNPGTKLGWPLAAALAYLLVFCSQAQNVQAQSVTLAWDPSPDNRVVGYMVYYGSSGSNYKNSKSCLVQVTVSYTFNPLPLLPKSAMTMHATSEKVILQ